MAEFLWSVWDEPRPSRPPPRVWRDWALVTLLVPAAVLEAVLRQEMPWRLGSALLTVGLVPTLLWRRTHPLLMVAIAFGACALSPLVFGGESELNTMAFVVLLPYALVRWGSGGEAMIGAAIIVGKVCLSAGLGYMAWGDAVGALVLLFAAMALGAAFRYRARSRMRELDQVKLLERERLARDLHDTVAHHVSAMAIRAQAGLATSGTDPDAAANALRLIEAEASRALAEMRTMVRTLRRNEPVDLAPAPQVTDLVRLAAPSRTGPPVDVEIVGDVAGLSPTVTSAIYRLVQESITNARRHARHATRIEVRVAADDTSVRLRVSDDGDASASRASSSPGYGLVGMRERVGLLGGACEAGPNPDRGWTVTAVLPRTGAAAA